ncbi:hypothetical protein A2U01_0072074, partial [Trifolium medium]|nr:hypothetical protein [Trifolium medium]
PFLRSPGVVVATWSPVKAKLSVDVSLSVAKRGGGDRDFVLID